MEMKPQKALAMAYNMKQKTQKMSKGGVCHACGGMVHGGRVSEQDTEQMGPQGSYMEEENKEQAPEIDGFESSESMEEDEPQYLSEGGGVDEAYEPHSINDTDGDNDDLEFSPEVSANLKEDDEEGDSDKRHGFLRAYMIHRKMRS